MASNPRMNITAVLSCGCTIVYKMHSPKLGDSVICRKHWSGGTVVEVLGQWAARCRDCRLHRGFGSNSAGAFAFGRRHVDRTGHTVRVWRVGDTEEDHEISPVIPGQEGLPF